MDAQAVNERTIFLMLSGSRAHGTHREDSDYDKTGVMIPPPKYFFGLDRVDHFRKFEGEDKVIYDFRKAICLLNDNNPNILDLLFSPERCTLILKEPWKKMLEHRDLFISRKCRNTYSGYAYAQLSRIETHRGFLLDPPKIKPERKDFGLPEFSIFPTAQIKGVVFAALGDFIIEEDKEDLLVELEDVYSNYIIPIFSRHIKPDLQALAMKYLHVGMKSQANTLKALGPSFIKDEYLEMATNELRFYCADAKWQQYQAWLKNRNKARAELERKFTFDTKHASHLVRLIRMCKEILETGKINVDRTNIDAEELKAIRYEGIWKYQDIVEYAMKIDKECGELYKTSTLQLSPDFEKIKTLCESICADFIKKEI